MKALTNLIFLILMLLCIPTFLYYMYQKTYASPHLEKIPSVPEYRKELQEKINENKRLQKEIDELKKHKERPLAQPPRPFGKGYTNPQNSNSGNSSKSLLSQPPRRVGQPPTPNEPEPHQESGPMKHQIEPADHLHE